MRFISASILYAKLVFQFLSSIQKKFGIKLEYKIEGIYLNTVLCTQVNIRMEYKNFGLQEGLSLKHFGIILSWFDVSFVLTISPPKKSKGYLKGVSCIRQRMTANE